MYAHRLYNIALVFVLLVVLAFAVREAIPQPLARENAAAADRWQKMADYYALEKAHLLRAESAYAQRWQARVDKYVSPERLSRSEQASALRWEAKADYYAQLDR